MGLDRLGRSRWREVRGRENFQAHTGYRSIQGEPVLFDFHLMCVGIRRLCEEGGIRGGSLRGCGGPLRWVEAVGGFARKPVDCVRL